MSEAVTYRRALIDDFQAAVKLARECRLPAEGIELFFPDNYVVAAMNDRLVGLAGIEIYEQFGLIRSVAVSHEARSGGIGRELVDRAIAFAKEKSLKELYLLTTDADKYFGQLRFETVDRAEVPTTVAGSAEFSSICPDSAIVMRMKLR